MNKTNNPVASVVRSRLNAERQRAGSSAVRTMLALEPRFMFDAAGVATAADAASHALPDDAYGNDAPDDSVQSLVSALADEGPAAVQAAATQRTEIVFIDTSIKDWTVLRDGVPVGVEVVLLDATRNGLEQMEQALAGRSGIDAIHVLSHGSDGQVSLGNFNLNSSNVDAHADALGRIGASLTSDGDLLLYGCDIASNQGDAFISRIAELTGADVAASDDMTGSAAMGGNWSLERTTGPVAASNADDALASSGFAGVLAAGTLDFSGPDNTNLGTVVTDGMAGSSNISGIDYQIYAAHANGTANGTVWAYYNDVGIGKDGIVGDMLSGDPVVVIRSANGAEFSFEGITTANVGVIHTRVTFEGFRDGVSTGSVTLEVDNAITGINTYTTADLPSGFFQNVDEVRITNPDIPDGAPERAVFLAFDSLVFGEPVNPNAAPVVDANGAGGGTTNTTTFTEDGAAVRIVTSDATLTDDDNLTSMTFTLGATPDGTDEIITYNAALNGGASLDALGLSGSYDSATRTYTISGSAAAPFYQGAMRAMVYSNASDGPNTTARTITISATDAEGGVGQTTTTINVVAVNDAPTATNLTQSLSATEGGGAVALNDIVITDVDTGDTVTATLTLSDPAAGSLSTGTFGSATSTWNPGTGVWTVSGSVADVNAALAAVALTPSANNDQNFTITTRIRDAADTGPADGTISFTVTPVNDAPTITAPGSIGVTEDVTSALTGISFTDVDAGANGVTVTLSVPSGTLAATSGSGVTVGGTSSALTLTGTIADINAFIAASNVTFTTASNATGSVTLTVAIDDGGNSGSGGAQQDQTTVTLNVTAVNDAPQITAPGSIALTVNEPEALTGISFADVDAGANDVTVTLSVPSGMLSASSGGGVMVGGTGSALTLTGTIADLNAFIAGSNVTYTTALDDTAAVTLTILINDNGNTGSGGAQQDSTTLTLSSSARPVITVGGSASYAEDGPATVVAPGLTITDSDSPTLAGAVVTLTDFVSGDELSFIDQNGIVGSYDSATGVLTLTGVATQAQYQAALRSITYLSTHDNPATGAGNADRVIEFRVSDGGLQSDAGTSQTLTVTNANDAPVLDASASPALNGLSEDAAPPVNGSTAGSTLVSALTGGISDVDSGALQGIAIVGASEQGLLWYSTNGGLTWTAAPALSDSSALLLASDARIYFQPAADVSGVIEDVITFRAWDRTTGVNGGTADTSAQGGATAFSTQIDSASISIAPVNDAPAIGSAPTFSGLEDSVVTIATGSLNFGDVDTGDSLHSITVTGLPDHGTLFLDANDNGVLDGGEAIAAGQVITAGDIDAGRFKFIAAANASGAGYASFQYTVSDGIASSTPATAVIDILPVNDAPTATNLTRTVTYVEDAGSVALGGIVVADVDTNDTIIATLTLSNVAAGSLSTGTFGAATSSYDANTGVWTVAGSVADVNAALAAVAFTPAANWDRNITVTTRIRDSAGTGPADGSIALNVTAANDAPVATGTIAAIEGRVDQSLHVVLPAGLFSDVDAGDELTLSVANLPAGLTFDAATGTISGTPTGEPGEHVVQLIATDRAGATATIAFSVRIAAPDLSPPQPPPPPPPPQPQAPPPWVNMESGPAIVPTPSSDPRTSGPGTAPLVMTLPEATPRISFSAPPPFAPIAMASQSRFGVDMPPLSESAPATPSIGSSGSLGFLTWNDASRQGSSSIVVQADPPDVAVERDASAAGSKIALPPRTFAAEGASQITIEASMADGRPLPSWVRFDPREGTFTLNPPKGFEGSLDVRVTAQTEQGQSATAEFKIVVSSKGDENAAHGGETARSKPSLSEQLRAAGEDGLLAEAAELLERLADAAA